MMNEQARLRWRCRRGMREMDILFQQFMEKYYSNLSDENKASFAALLEESDPDIMNWIMDKTTPENTNYIPLIKLLQTLNTNH